MPKPLTRVWFSAEAMGDLVFESGLHLERETGGMLLGYRNEGAVVVSAVIGPGPAAEHHRSTFRPDSDWQRGEVARIYGASGRITTYLGDWHTHPGGGPRLSPRDRRTLRGIAAAKGARQPQPLMAVLAFDGDPRAGELVVWELRARWRRPRPCHVRLVGLEDEPTAR